MSSIADNIASGVYEKVFNSVNNKRKKSDVWNTFAKYRIAETKEPLPFAVCEVCGTSIKYRKGCTTTLLRHPCYQKQQAEALNPDGNVKKIKKFHITEELVVKVKEACVKFCAVDLRPYSAVEGEGFKNVAKCLVEVGTNSPVSESEIDDILPSRTTISRYAQKVHQRELSKLVEVIKPIIERGECCATTDLWTSDVNKKNYLTLTVHYLDDLWEMQSRVLFTVHYPSTDKEGEVQTKSAENLRNFLEAKFSLIGLPGAFDHLTFVTDQGSNLVKMLRNQDRLSCAAHVLNTVLRNSFDAENLQSNAPAISDTIKNTKALVENFKRTAKEEDLPTALKQECQTRWNTKFDMLESVYNNFGQIKEILEKRRELKKIEGINEYILRRLVKLLEPFKTATQRLENEKKATTHMVMVTIEELKMNLTNFMDEESNSGLKYVAERCKNFIEEKFEFHNFQKIGAFLWPGYQDLNFLNQNEQKHIRNLVTDQLRELAERAESNLNSSDSSSSCSSEDCNTELKSLEKFRNKPKKKSDSRASLEVKAYKLKQAPSNADVQQWWRHRQGEFPLLSALARKILAIPATSASSERSFSVAGRVLEERRNKLCPENLDAIIFLHSAHQCHAY